MSMGKLTLQEASAILITTSEFLRVFFFRNSAIIVKHHVNFGIEIIGKQVRGLHGHATVWNRLYAAATVKTGRRHTAVKSESGDLPREPICILVTNDG